MGRGKEDVPNLNMAVLFLGQGLYNDISSCVIAISFQDHVPWLAISVSATNICGNLNYWFTELDDILLFFVQACPPEKLPGAAERNGATWNRIITPHHTGAANKRQSIHSGKHVNNNIEHPEWKLLWYKPGCWKPHLLT